MRSQNRRHEKTHGKWLVRYDYPDIDAEVRLVVTDLPAAIGKRVAEGKLEKLLPYGYTEARDIRRFGYSGYEYFHIPNDRTRDHISGCVISNDDVCIELSCRKRGIKPPLFKNVTIFKVETNEVLR